MRDYLATQGYVLDAKESTKTSFKMRGAGEVIFLALNENDVWVYWNPLDHDDKGTIINFIQNRRGGRQNFTLGHVKAHLRGKVQPVMRGAVVPGVPRPVMGSPHDISAVATRWAKWSLNFIPKYLESRGIAVATFEAFAPKMRMDRRGNVLFGHTNQDGQIVGYEIKGKSFTGFSKGGIRLLCRMGPLDGAAPVKIALTESGLDALSLAQLVARRDAIYCSTGGALSDRTVDQIRRLAEKYPTAEILLAFDRDDSGEKFAGAVGKVLAGRDNVRRLLPQVGKDWNDVLRHRNSRPTGPLKMPT